MGRRHPEATAWAGSLFLALILTTLPLMAAERPNILFILCDDLGIGDLGVLHQTARRAAGQPSFETPVLDRLATEGILLERHYTAAPVCAPARASFLLGVHQGHAGIRDNQFDRELEDRHTVASVLRSAGYATAVIGKWGLQGGPQQAGTPASPSYPTRRGFDSFFGMLDHAAGHRHYPAHDPVNSSDPDGANSVWADGSNVTHQLAGCYSTDLFTARAKRWITRHHRRSPDVPFFLYLAYTAPHAALQVPTMAYPPGGGLEGGVQWTGKPGAMINTATGTPDTWIHPDYADRKGWSEANTRHATMVRRLDSAVGDLQALLDDLDLGDDTLVVFTSDNGPHAEGSWTGIVQDPRFFQSYGTLDGIKRDTWEAGIRVPTLARWPAGIPPGRVTNHPSQFHDWMATFADLAGIPPPARSDGVSLLPSLTGQGQQKRGTVYVEYSVGGATPAYEDFDPAHRGRSWQQQQVIFRGRFKALRRGAQSAETPFEVYDLEADPEERINLAGAEDVPGQKELEATVLRLRRPHPEAPRPWDAAPVPALDVSPKAPGWTWAIADGPFPYVPDFGSVHPRATGRTDRLDLSRLPPIPQRGAVQFEGILQVPETGRYTLDLHAREASVFARLHDIHLLEADAPGADGEVAATVALEAGPHPLRIILQPLGPEPALQLNWQGPSFPSTPLLPQVIHPSSAPTPPQT